MADQVGKFNYGKIFIVGFGSFGFSLIWIVYNAFVPLFLANRFGLSPAFIGFFMTLDNIAALLIQPPVGAMSDRLRTPLGRRLPFILVGAPVGALAFGLIPIAAVLPLFVACTITLLLSMAVWRTPVVALMADVTPSQYRSQANGITNFMGGVGGIIGSLGGGALYNLNPAYPFWLGAGLVIFAAAMLLLFVREPREFVTTTEEKPSLSKSFVEVLHDPDRSALRMFLAILTGYVAYNAIEAFFTLYATNHLGVPAGDAASLLGHFILLLILFALPAGWIGGWFGRRRSILLGMAVLLLTLLIIYFLPAATLAIPLAKLPVVGTLRSISPLLMLGGIAWAMVNVNVLPMVVDMTDDLRIGTYTGLYYIFYTLAAIAGPNINGWIVQLTGGDYNRVMLASPLFFFLAIWLISGVRRGEAKKLK